MFFDNYGPVVLDGFTFEGGYTHTINTGDGDFLTEDTLWDFKVSLNKPTSAHTLQLLIYYIIGKHSIHEEFNSIKKLGIYNPRKNSVYLKKVADIPNDIIEIVSREVIGYDKETRHGILDDENNDYYSLIEIMKLLKCSRYMVMKYYSEEDLPLKKMKNQYYVDKDDLYKWVQKKVEEERKQKRMSIIIGLLTLVATILFIIFMIKII